MRHDTGPQNLERRDFQLVTGGVEILMNDTATQDIKRKLESILLWGGVNFKPIAHHHFITFLFFMS